MKQKIGDWTEDQFETKVKKIVKDVVKEVVKEEVATAIENTRPPWVDRMLELLDQSAGNYKKIDEEQTLLSGKQSNHSDELEKIDKRVTHIEKHFKLTPVV